VPLKNKISISWFRVIYLILVAIAMYLLASQISQLKGSIGHLKASNKIDDLIVLIFVISTYFFAALTYFSISLKPIKYLRTLIIQFGISTLNKFLPAGLGTISGNYAYLHKSGHSKDQSVAIVATDSIIGVIANLLLLTILIAYLPFSKFNHLPIKTDLILIIILAILLVAAVILSVPIWRRNILKRLKSILHDIYYYRFLKKKLFYGLLCQIGLTLAYVLALSFSLKSVSVSIPIGSVMVAYSFAIWLGTVIPAPGGAGSVDAGLVSGLLIFKISLPQVVAAVIIFRLISFWLPAVIGIAPLVWSYRRRYL
jgi:uncharacterized membrane protein YbhN (UPF0104 family)